MSRIGGGFRWFARLSPLTGCSRSAVVLAAFSAFATASAVTGSAKGQIPCRYEVLATIQAPPGPSHASPTVPMAISSNGQHVVGYFSLDGAGEAKPWYWSQATGFIALAMPPGFYASTPQGVNDNRILVATGWQTGPGQRGYIHDLNSGQFTEIEPLPGGAWSGCNAINNNNEACGFRSIGSAGDPVNPKTAFVYSGGVVTDLGLIDGQATTSIDIAEDGVIAVEPATSTIGPFAHIWGRFGALNLGAPAGCEATFPNAIGSGGKVVGASIVTGSGGLWSLPFMYSGGSIDALPVLGGRYDRGTALSLNDSGTAVGACRRNVNPPNWRACVWQGGIVRNLNSLIPPSSGVLLLMAVGVSVDGIVLNSATSSGATVSVVLRALVPKLGDTNCDELVNVSDLLNVIGEWGATESFADVNADSIVNVGDLLVVIGAWGT